MNKWTEITKIFNDNGLFEIIQPTPLTTISTDPELIKNLRPDEKILSDAVFYTIFEKREKIKKVKVSRKK